MKPMRPAIHSVTFTLLVLAESIACSRTTLPSGESDETSTPTQEPSREPGESIIAPAPRGLSLNDLGRPLTRDFIRLQGPDGRSMFPSAAQPQRTPQHAFEHHVETIDSQEEWAAHAVAWGLGAGVGDAHANRFASYRAVQITEVHEIDDTTAMANAPRHAVYYPWRIYMGFGYEVVFQGSADRFHAGVKAELPVFSGSIEDFTRRHELEWKARGRGLQPIHGRAIFARTTEALEASYAPSANEPVPILVEWRRIPGREGHVEAIDWVELRGGCAGEPGCEVCRSWSFERIEVTFPRRKADGRAWDADDSPPDTVLTLRVDRDHRVSTKQEAYERTWMLDSAVTVSPGESLQLRAIDSDLVADDPMFSLTATVPGTLEGGRLAFGSGTAVATGRCVDPEAATSMPRRRVPRRIKVHRSQ
jgi:hypothetical protein